MEFPKLDSSEGEVMLIMALAGGKSHEAAAELAGVCRKTVHNRLQNPEFQAKVNSIRQGMIQRAVGQMADAAVDAVKVLRNVLATGDSCAVQVQAARAILAYVNLEEVCPECKRRAEAERNKPPITLDELLAADARLKAELAEAQRLNDEEEAKRPPVPNILAYADQD